MDGAKRETEKEEKNGRWKVVIIILVVLLALSAAGLAGRYLYLRFFVPAQTTQTVPDNLIGEEETSSETASLEEETASEETESGTGTGTGSSAENGSAGTVDKPKAAVLELYQGKPEDNRRFEVENMLPGDSVTQYFCIKASHDQDITVYFSTEITEQTKNLGEVLHIKVTHLESGKVLCDAPFSEVDKQEFSELLKKSAQGETTAYYRIDVSVDTSVGNEYQAAGLKADFKWYVKEEDGLTAPETGAGSEAVLISVAMAALAGILLMLVKRRKEER